MIQFLKNNGKLIASRAGNWIQEAQADLRPRRKGLRLRRAQVIAGSDDHRT